VSAPEPNYWPDRYARARDFLVPWVELTVPLAGRTVLEYGCGHGPVSCAFAERAGRVIGVDIDTALVEEGRRRVTDDGVADRVELERHPVEEILDAVRARRGEVDVFLLYAVLEHLTLDERLAVLEVTREVTREDGAIVMCETPNRLIPFDHHTTRVPFMTMLPDELAWRYRDRSDREDFLDAMASAAARGEEEAREAWVRWGRGVSFHEFELVFEDLREHVIASSYDVALFEERPIHSEELALARYLKRVRPDLAPCFSRSWLDLVLTPRPHGRRPAFLRPWTMETAGSPGVAWTRDTLQVFGRATPLRVALPAPSGQVVVGVMTETGRVAVEVDAAGARGPLVVSARGSPTTRRTPPSRSPSRPRRSSCASAPRATSRSWAIALRVQPPEPSSSGRRANLDAERRHRRREPEASGPLRRQLIEHDCGRWARNGLGKLIEGGKEVAVAPSSPTLGDAAVDSRSHGGRPAPAARPPPLGR